MKSFLSRLENFFSAPLIQLKQEKLRLTLTNGECLQFFLLFIAFSVVLLTIKKKGYAWILNIIKKLLGGLIYLTQGLYAKIILDSILVAKSGYGLYKCGYKSKKRTQKDVTSLSPKELTGFFLVAVGASILLGWILHFVYKSFPHIKGKRPLIDGFHTAFSIINYYLLAQKKRESWLFSLSAQIAFAYLFISSYGAKPMAIKYLGYILLSIRGYYLWGQQARKKRRG